VIHNVQHVLYNHQIVLHVNHLDNKINLNVLVKEDFMMLELQIVHHVIINVQLVKYKLIIVKLVKEIDMVLLVFVLIIIMKMVFH